jgi:hypothetical protein
MAGATELVNRPRQRGQRFPQPALRADAEQPVEHHQGLAVRPQERPRIVALATSGFAELFPHQRTPIFFAKGRDQMHRPAHAGKLPGRHERIAAIVSLSKNREAHARPRIKLRHRLGNLRPGLLHQQFRRDAIRERLLLEGFHRRAR